MIDGRWGKSGAEGDGDPGRRQAAVLPRGAAGVGPGRGLGGVSKLAAEPAERREQLIAARGVAWPRPWSKPLCPAPPGLRGPRSGRQALPQVNSLRAIEGAKMEAVRAASAGARTPDLRLAAPLRSYSRAAVAVARCFAEEAFVRCGRILPSDINECFIGL